MAMILIPDHSLGFVLFVRRSSKQSSAVGSKGGKGVFVSVFSKPEREHK